MDSQVARKLLQVKNKHLKNPYNAILNDWHVKIHVADMNILTDQVQTYYTNMKKLSAQTGTTFANSRSEMHLMDVSQEYLDMFKHNPTGFLFNLSLLMKQIHHYMPEKNSTPDNGWKWADVLQRRW